MLPLFHCGRGLVLERRGGGGEEGRERRGEGGEKEGRREGEKGGRREGEIEERKRGGEIGQLCPLTLHPSLCQLTSFFFSSSSSSTSARDFSSCSSRFFCSYC